ncbi:MAG: phosphoglycerate kinase [Firmicutes bacterium]|nr:phosphoglycerate kinase [Bacillota bacterium]
MYYDNKLTIRDIDVAGKKVLVRVDFNVPLDAEGNVTDATRIKAARPTIEYLSNNGAKVILCSHLGRPKGTRNPKYSLAPVALKAREVLGRPVIFSPNVLGETVENLIAAMPEGGVMLLENVRFYAEEEKNDPEFAKQLAALADIYVNDAFGTAHRAHASTEGVARFLPGVCGFLMEKEVRSLGDALSRPARPFVAIIGGAKVSDKIQVVENLMDKVDKLLIGGGMANTFLAAQGYNMQASLVEEGRIEWAKEFMAQYEDKLVLPIDVVAADSFSDMASTMMCSPEDIKEGWQALDIGTKTIAMFSDHIKRAGTVFWNGPLGVFELENFMRGTMRIAQAVADCSGFTIVGGGDSVAAIAKAGVEDKINHVSTGGGASLEFLGGEILPGIDALAAK